MIITLSEIETILGITVDIADVDRYESMIQFAQDHVIGYCNNYFLNYNVQFVGSATIGTNSITGAFENLVPGQYKLRGSLYNDGVITVTEATSTTLTVSETLTSETAEVIITKIDFPKSIKPDVAFLIKWLIQRQGKLESSESVSGYSVQYKDYSQIMKPFNKYRKL